MFRACAESKPSTVAKPLPQIKEASVPRSSSHGGLVEDSEASEVESETPGDDPLAEFYDEARALEDEQVRELIHLSFIGTLPSLQLPLSNDEMSAPVKTSRVSHPRLLISAPVFISPSVSM